MRINNGFELRIESKLEVISEPGKNAKTFKKAIIQKAFPEKENGNKSF